MTPNPAILNVVREKWAGKKGQTLDYKFLAFPAGL
jgi:hypothetical protein